MLKCSFGGYDNNFVSVGGEDGKIHIWHKYNQKNVWIIDVFFIIIFISETKIFNILF